MRHLFSSRLTRAATALAAGGARTTATPRAGRTGVVVLGGLLGLAGCGDASGPADVIPAELAGSWEASPACLPDCGFTFVSTVKSSDTMNVVSAFGVSLDVTLTRAGRFEMVARPGAVPPVTGQARTEGSLLIVRDAAGVADTIDYAVTATHLSLAFRGTAQVDFNGDQQTEAATARGRFRRR